MVKLAEVHDSHHLILCDVRLGRNKQCLELPDSLTFYERRFVRSGI